MLTDDAVGIKMTMTITTVRSVKNNEINEIKEKYYQSTIIGMEMQQVQQADRCTYPPVFPK